MFFIHTHPARACPCAKNAVFTFHLNPFFANYFSTLCFWASFFKALVISSSDKFTEKAPSILQMMSTRSKIVFGLVGIALIKFKRASLLMYAPSKIHSFLSLTKRILPDVNSIQFLLVLRSFPNARKSKYFLLLSSTYPPTSASAFTAVSKS